MTHVQRAQQKRLLPAEETKPVRKSIVQAILVYYMQ